MHIQVRDRIAILKFETGQHNITHNEIVNGILHCLDIGFNNFILDFEKVDINFNSTISGFVLSTTKKLINAGALVTIKNISQVDLDLLRLIGFDESEIKCEVRQC